MAATYLDSSAIVKLVVAEPESAALRRWLARRPPPVSSALAQVEVVRAVRLHGTAAVDRATDALGRLDLLRITDVVLGAAARLAGPLLRPLDAIHLATAMQLGDDLKSLVAYDIRLLAAAEELGVRTVSPS